MTTKTKVIISIVALTTAYAFGRYSAPEKIKIETKVVEVEKTSEKKSEDKKTKTKTEIVTITRPDGTKEERRIVTDTSEDKTKQSESASKLSKKEESKEITNSSSKVTVSALAGFNIFAPGIPDYGMSVTRPVIGPITVGIFGFKSGMLGASLGLTF